MIYYILNFIQFSILFVTFVTVLCFCQYTFEFDKKSLLISLKGGLFAAVICNFLVTMGLVSAYRMVFLASLIYIFAVQKKNCLESVLWTVIYYAMTVILDDLIVILYENIFNLRTTAAWIPLLKLLGKAALFLSSTCINAVYISYIRKNCVYHLNSLSALTAICFLSSVMVDLYFLIYINTLSNSVPFIILSVVLMVISSLAVLMYGLISAYFRRVLQLERENERSRYLVKAQEEMENTYQTIRQVRHDIYNHINTVESFIRKGNIEEGRQYLVEVKKQIPFSVSSGCSSVDMLLHTKFFVMQSLDIEFEFHICDLKEHPLNDVELNAVLGNLLDNAIEAQRYLKESGERSFINLTIVRRRDMLKIQCVNPADESRIRKDREGQLLSIKGLSEHGQGLKIIQTIAEKAGGECMSRMNKDIFISEVYLPYL